MIKYEMESWIIDKMFIYIGPIQQQDDTCVQRTNPQAKIFFKVT